MFEFWLCVNIQGGIGLQENYKIMGFIGISNKKIVHILMQNQLIHQKLLQLIFIVSHTNQIKENISLGWKTLWSESSRVLTCSNNEWRVFKGRLVRYEFDCLNVFIMVQMFHLIPTPEGRFFVQNDMFRLNYGWKRLITKTNIGFVMLNLIPPRNQIYFTISLVLIWKPIYFTITLVKMVELK